MAIPAAAQRKLIQCDRRMGGRRLPFRKRTDRISSDGMRQTAQKNGKKNGKYVSENLDEEPEFDIS